MEENWNLSEDEWKQRLTKDEYHVLRNKGTEPPFCGEHTDNKGVGIYHCAACELPLFSSDHKYHSGSGWPSFFHPISEDSVAFEQDGNRIEVLCPRCRSHLGHIFPDGPPPSGHRYCINSIALKFKESGNV